MKDLTYELLEEIAIDFHKWCGYNGGYMWPYQQFRAYMQERKEKCDKNLMDEQQ